MFFHELNKLRFVVSFLQVDVSFSSQEYVCMGSTFCRKVTTMDPAFDEDKPFDKKKTVRVSGVSHFLLDQITKQFQGNNSTGYQDDVNRLYICPNGEDHVLVEFANDIPKSKFSTACFILEIKQVETRVCFFFNTRWWNDWNPQSMRCLQYKGMHSTLI